MSDLTALEGLYEALPGPDLPLPAELASLYGTLRFPPHAGRAYVIGNFVTTLDGVVSLNIPGKSGGGEISGFNRHDRMVMGILRAVADAVVVGAGTLRAVPRHLWTAQHIYPPLAAAYGRFRAALGKTTPPLNVVVTGSGDLDLGLPVFRSGEVPVLIVTTARGAGRLAAQPEPAGVEVATVDGERSVSAHAVLAAVRAVRPSDLILVEGGPQLMGDFFGERCLDELFLTVAPQIAGRDASTERPGLVAGQQFAPDNPVWGTLVGVKRAGSHLFLRYAFGTG